MDLLISFSVQVHMSVPHVENFIDLLVSIPAEGHTNSFAYIMSEWTRQQGKFLYIFVFSSLSFSTGSAVCW